MIVTNCPRCDESFRIPSGQWPDDAYVQCPWCEETLPISEVLLRLPPVVKILSAEGDELQVAEPARAHAMVAAGEIDEAPAGADISAMGEFTEIDELDLADPTEAEESEFTEIDELELGQGTVAAETVTDETVADASWTGDATQDVDVIDDQFTVQEPESPGPGGLTDAAPMSVSSKPRPRKPQGSPIRKFIGIVLGGLAAIPLAIVILYIFTLFGKEIDLGFWPLDGSNSSSSRRPSAAPPIDLTNRQPTDNRSLLSKKTRSLIADASNDNEASSNDSGQASALQELGIGAGDPSSGDPSSDESSGQPEQSNLVRADDLDKATGGSDSITMPDLGDGKIELEPLEDPGIEITDIANPVEDPSMPDPEVTDLAETPVPDSVAETPVVEPSQTEQPAEVTPPEEVVRVPNSPQLIANARAAAKSLKELKAISLDDPNRVSKRDATYITVAHVADAATSDSSVAQQMLTFLKTSPLLSELSEATPAWLDRQDRPCPGVLMVGPLDTSGAAPTITLSEDRVITLSGAIDALPADQRVIAIGRIVSEGEVELVAAEPLP